MRTTLPFSGRQGSTEMVAGSGCRNRSECTAPPKPAMAEASKAMPYSKARSSSAGMMEMFFCLPKMSQKARRMNFTSSSATYCRTSSLEYFMRRPPFSENLFLIIPHSRGFFQRRTQFSPKALQNPLLTNGPWAGKITCMKRQWRLGGRTSLTPFFFFTGIPGGTMAPRP